MMICVPTSIYGIDIFVSESQLEQAKEILMSYKDSLIDEEAVLNQEEKINDKEKGMDISENVEYSNLGLEKLKATTLMYINRNRLTYLLLTVLVMLLGLASRRFSMYLPIWINSYLGDTLWALMVFMIFGAIFNKASTKRVASIALVFTFSIELSQLYQSPWINEIRSTRLGGLILGYGFLWKDITSYIIGVTLGFVGEKKFT